MLEDLGSPLNSWESDASHLPSQVRLSPWLLQRGELASLIQGPLRRSLWLGAKWHMFNTPPHPRQSKSCKYLKNKESEAWNSTEHISQKSYLCKPLEDWKTCLSVHPALMLGPETTTSCYMSCSTQGRATSHLDSMVWATQLLTFWLGHSTAANPIVK